MGTRKGENREGRKRKEKKKKEKGTRTAKLSRNIITIASPAPNGHQINLSPPLRFD